MKTQLFHAVLFVSSLLIPARAAQAQYGYGYSSTAAEGYLHGSADLARGMGEYNLLTSQAEINMQEARSRAIDNRRKGVDTYWETRQMNESQRAQRRPRPATPSETSRWNQSRLPGRLSVSQFDAATGAVHWHGVLENDEYASGRTELARLFAERQTGKSGAGSRNCREIKRTVDEMNRQLARDARRISGDEYIPAKNLLDSLAYEARFAPHGPSDELAAK